MARPLKIKPTCNVCGRGFARKNNLAWHMATHDGAPAATAQAPPVTLTGDLPVKTASEGDSAIENCTNCHTLEHTIERRDGEIQELSKNLTDAATQLRQPAENPGHHQIADLIDCPSCGPAAVEQFATAGGAILEPGKVKPQLVELLKTHFPIFGAELTI